MTYIADELPITMLIAFIIIRWTDFCTAYIIRAWVEVPVVGILVVSTLCPFIRSIKFCADCFGTHEAYWRKA